MSWVRPLRLFPAWRSLLWDVKEVGKRQSWALKVGPEGVRQGLYKDTHPTVRAVLPLGRLPEGKGGGGVSSPWLEVCKQGALGKDPAVPGIRKAQAPAASRSSVLSCVTLGKLVRLPQAPRAPTVENRGTAPTLQGFEKTRRARSGVFDKRQHLPQPSLHTQENSAGQTQARLAASHPLPTSGKGPAPSYRGFWVLSWALVPGGSGLDPGARGRGRLEWPLSVLRAPSRSGGLWIFSPASLLLLLLAGRPILSTPPNHCKLPHQSCSL